MVEKTSKKLIIDEEGFSGKRPFGNSCWKSDVEVALIKVGALRGQLDSDGFVKHLDEPVEPDLIAIINSWK